MQEINATILSTRPVDTGLVALAAGQGILLEAISFIETEAVLPDAPAEQRMKDLYSQPVTVAFTSMNAVEAVASRTGKFQAAGKPDPGWQIFCIGQATRQTVTRYFGEKAIAGTADSARALAETILVFLKKERSAEERESFTKGKEDSSEIIFFCGDQRKDELPDHLRKQGVRVTEIVVYRTTRTAHPLEKQYDGIVFFSPSAVDSFFSANTLPETTVLFAIGATTAAAIGKYNHNRVISAETPAKETLIRQAIDYFTKT